MSQFKAALDLVIDHLEARKRLLHQPVGVSQEVMARLVATKNAATVPPESKTVKPSPLQIPAEPAKAQSIETTFSSHVALTSGSKIERNDALRGLVLPCIKCAHLAASRTQVVFGVGDLDAKLMFVGEAPGEDEDLQGEPFVGKAGQLLTKMIQAMGLQREQVYIGNVLKCRPNMPLGTPGNRKPTSAEMATCLPWLREQIDIIRPRVLVGLGATALEGLLGETRPMNQLRGRWHDFQGIPLMATYHPAYLLRNQSVTEKRKVWEDLLMVMEKLALPISDKQRGFFLK